MNQIVKPCLLVAGLLLACAGIASAQADRERARRLLSQAEQEMRAGNVERANACFAEGWAVMADVYWLEGNRTSSNEAWRNAERYGWKGEAPWVKWPPTRRDERPTPPPRYEPQPPPRSERGTQEPPRRDPWGRDPRRTETAVSNPFTYAPYKTGRNNVWHSIFNIPALEDAVGASAGRWLVHLDVELSSGEMEDTTEGGTTRWNADLLQESLEANYFVSDALVLGARLTTGELLEVSDDLITVFDDGQQIIPNGKRSFAVESLVVRGKYLLHPEFADLGVLVEIKIPIADEEDILTSQTWDIGVSGLITKRLSAEWGVTLNVGVVLPVGDTDLFVATEDEDPDPIVQGGLAITFAATQDLTFALQADGNTSALNDIEVINETVFGAYLSGRYRITRDAFLRAVIGRGFGDGDFGSELTVGLGIDVVF